MLKKIILVSLLLAFFILPVITLAATPGLNGTAPQPAGSGNTYALDNPLGNNSSDVHTVIQNIIKALLGLVGVLALVMFIIGGFKVMTAQGDGKKAQAGFQTLLWATVGLIIIFASRILLNTILGAF